MESYEELLVSIRPKVSFGYTTIHICRPSELSSHQIGYSIGPSGESLIGDQDGDWLKNWLVIGYADTGFWDIILQ